VVLSGHLASAVSAPAVGHRNRETNRSFVPQLRAPIPLRLRWSRHPC
jgi:hypothetical protein